MAQKIVFLSTKEISAVENLYQPGKPLLWVLSFGWAIVGYYVRHESPLRIRVAHGSYFQKAGKDYASLAREGAGPDTIWNYVGNTELNATHILRVDEYLGKVIDGPIIR